jgi:hypothetical protein
VRRDGGGARGTEGVAVAVSMVSVGLFNGGDLGSAHSGVGCAAGAWQLLYSAALLLLLLLRQAPAQCRGGSAAGRHGSRSQGG